MTQQAQQNPLTQYYRRVKSYIALPSGTSYYDPKVLEFTESGEVAIRAMTSSDEMILKNPDALLNGEAIRQILKSCVVGMNDPDKILINDIDVLLIAIRKVSFGDSTAMELACPKCEHQDTYRVDLDKMLAEMDLLDAEYPVNLDSGATVFVKPFTYKDSINAATVAFEQQKAVSALEASDMEDRAKLQLFSKSIKSIEKLNYNLLSSSILRIVDAAAGLEFENSPTNLKFIKDMLHNIDIGDVNKIDVLIKEINVIGVRKKLQAKCTEEACGHEWDADIDLNPSTFFSQS